MGRVTGARRYRVGRDLTVSELTGEGGRLEGRQVLPPGAEIVLVGLPPPLGPGDRRALVVSWAVVALGKNGTVFGGLCRWPESDGERAAGSDQAEAVNTVPRSSPAWHQT